jgi:hypothetical protein
MSITRKTPSVLGNHNSRRAPSVAGSISSKPPIAPENHHSPRKESPVSFDGWLQTANEKGIYIFFFSFTDFYI